MFLSVTDARSGKEELLAIRMIRHIKEADTQPDKAGNSVVFYETGSFRKEGDRYKEDTKLEVKYMFVEETLGVIADRLDAARLLAD